MLGPSLHTLEKDLRARGYRVEYAARMLDLARAFKEQQVPTIFSLMHLASLSRARWSYLRAEVERKANSYRTFTIGKRTGGHRLICAPAPDLRRAQAWIHKNILQSPGALSLLHPAATAYKPKASILKNAKAHAGATWMVKLDIKDFFESISERQVFYVFRQLGYPALLCFELARLCTRRVPPRRHGPPRVRESMVRWVNWEYRQQKGPYPFEPQIGHLPQGAPTSAMLANLVVRVLDARIEDIAIRYSATYTRYADDMVLTLTDGSNAQCTVLFREVAQVITRSGFRINRSKSRVVGPGGRKTVTGLVVNDFKPRLPKSMKEEINLALYHIGKHGLLDHMKRRNSKRPLGYLNHLVGKILYCHSIEPAFADASMATLRKALHPNRELIQVAMAFESSGKPPKRFQALYQIIFGSQH